MKNLTKKIDTKVQTRFSFKIYDKVSIEIYHQIGNEVRLITERTIWRRISVPIRQQIKEELNEEFN